MIGDFFYGLGGWTWFVVGLLLLVGEILLPGTFLVWFGLSALIVGTVTVTPFLGLVWWTWQAQIVVFGLLSLLLVMIGQKFGPPRGAASETMNRPMDRFVGRDTVLTEAIVNGRGRVHLGDTDWTVMGADLPVGAQVRVVGAENGVLQVEAA
ncbi:NfeD family protein [Rhizobiaceae bacterium]|nr:NfeD family protein [Rhizobiaceae bacterium]